MSRLSAGLTIIIAGADESRFQAALELAAANAALGRRTRLFIQSAAVSLLRPDHPSDGPQAGAKQLLIEAIALGAEVSLCQSGLALAGMRADELPTGVETSGLVELLAGRGDDQLLMV